MIFRSFGNVVARLWGVLPFPWLGLLAVVVAFAPAWPDVVVDGEFAFLPDQEPSLVGERVFSGSFSKNFWGSSVMIVARRDSSPEARLTTDDDVSAPLISDREFVEEILVSRLRRLIAENGWDQPTVLADGTGPPEPPLVAKISTARTDREIGPLLDSTDGQATLVRISLNSEFMELRNAPLIDAVEQLTDPIRGELRRDALIPPGLDLYLSGPAVVGKDMREAAKESANATESATVLLVVLLLLLIYRAPILALIPLVTVFIAVKISLGLLAMLARLGVVELFNGIEVYVTVVMYGAGVDYCMFLMARYKEELDAGATFDEAIAGAIGNVGAALVASAGTTAVGIGMMVFAEFGKFRQAGVAMSFSLVVVLLASLTFTPALLRVFGRWAFWPRIARERLAEAPGWISPTRFASRILDMHRLQGLWNSLADSMTRRPGTWWVSAMGLMLPFALIGVLLHDKLTYGLLEELPRDTLSIQGAQAVQDHFPAGEAAPLTVLISDPDTYFGGKGVSTAAARPGTTAIQELTERLWERRETLGIADIRSLHAAHGLLRQADKNFIERGGLMAVAQNSPYYVSDQGSNIGRMTRLDVVFSDDPFSRDSLARFERLEQEIEHLLPATLKGSDIYFIGPTASIRDLKEVTNRDQVRINLLVLAGVFAVLIALLRQIMIAGYLIFTVFFSYLVTLGVTFGVFWAMSTGEFVGLDWKVPIFLFTILVAVGQDYNIYLITRVDEEQQRRGGVLGVRDGLARTGGIISSCGLIMAGTFCSLMFGSLAGMIQLGFALAFGVILDTFVVRPILVPAYLVMLNDGRFGSVSGWLGAYRPSTSRLATLAGDSPDVEEPLDQRSAAAPP